MIRHQRLGKNGVQSVKLTACASMVNAVPVRAKDLLQKGFLLTLTIDICVAPICIAIFEGCNDSECDRLSTSFPR